MIYNVQILWEGNKNLKNIPFVLWPSENIWTLRRILLQCIVSKIKRSTVFLNFFSHCFVSHNSLDSWPFLVKYHTIGCLSGMFWASLTIWYSSRFVIFVVTFSIQHQFNSHCWVSTIHIFFLLLLLCLTRYSLWCMCCSDVVGLLLEE